MNKIRLRYITLCILMLSAIAPARGLSSAGSNIVSCQLPGGGIVDPIQLEDEITTFDYCGRSALRDAFRAKRGKKKLDEETGLYYYGARYYDPRQSMWLGTDPMQGKYPDVSTYAYCMGNPVNAVDVDGKKSYLIIWTSDAYHYGHAAFAVDNYKYDSQSKKMVPDGTLTSYSLFPISTYSITQTIRDEKVRGLFLVDRNVSLDAIRNNEYNSGEDYKPDGIIEINSDYIHDTEAKRHMESEIQSNRGYRGRSRNCSTFAREGVKKATGKDVNGEERSLLIFNYVTPNKLFQDTRIMENTNVLKDPGGKENNTFVPF